MLARSVRIVSPQATSVNNQLTLRLLLLQLYFLTHTGKGLLNKPLVFFSYETIFQAWDRGKANSCLAS